MYKKLISFLYLSAIFGATPVPLELVEPLTFIQMHLPHKGILSQAENGLLYLKVPDAYIEQLYAYFGEDIVPPPYFGPGRIGAHITVAHSNEVEKLLIPQLGKEISFYVVGLFVVKPDRPDWERVYYAKIESPEIENIRASLGLSPRIPGKDFHITIGIKETNPPRRPNSGKNNSTCPISLPSMSPTTEF